MQLMLPLLPAVPQCLQFHSACSSTVPAIPQCLQDVFPEEQLLFLLPEPVGAVSVSRKVWLQPAKGWHHA